MSKKILEKILVPVIFSPSVLSFSNYLFIENVFPIRNKSNLIENIYNNSNNIYKQNTSKSEIIINAIKEYLEKQVFSFYDIEDFEDLNQLNQKILPVLISELNNTILNVNGIDLIYDQNDLFIIKYFSHTSEQLIIQLKYLTEKVLLKINFQSVDNNDILALGIQKLFNKSLTFEKNNLLSFFIWENSNSVFEQVQKWIKNILVKNSLKINDKFVKIDFNKLNFYMINLSNWSLEHVIKIFYFYGDSKSLNLEIPIDEVIIPPDITNLIHKNIQKSKVNFELNEKVSYKNFNQSFPKEDWIKKIIDIFNKNPLVFKNRTLNFNPQNISFNTKQNQILTPWTKDFWVNCSYQIENQSIPFRIKTSLKSKIDYQEISSNFKNNIKNLILDGDVLKNKNQVNIKEIIKDNIKNIVNDKLIIDNIEYPMILNDLTINSYNFLYKNNNPIIIIKLFSSLIGSEELTIEIKLINGNSLFFEIVCNYLAKYSKNSPFDIKQQINENNTWYDVIDLIIQDMTDNGVDSTIIDKIDWNSYYGNSLNYKLINDGLSSTSEYKNLIIGFEGLQIPKYTLYIENIKLTDQFKVNNVHQKFLLKQKTKNHFLWAHWNKNQIVTKEELGIEEPENLYGVDIKYKVVSVDSDNGKVTIEVAIEKNQVKQVFNVNIDNFVSSKILISKISTFFSTPFDLKYHLFSVKNHHFDGYKKALEFIKLILDKNIIALKEIKIINPDSLIKNTNQNHGDDVEIEIKIGNMQTAIIFQLKNVLGNELEKIINQTTNKKHFFPSWEIGTFVTAEDLGIVNPSICCGLKILYSIQKIDYKLNQIAVIALVMQNKTVLFRKPIIIDGFDNKVNIYKEIINLFKSWTKNNPFDVKNKISKNDTWKDLFSYIKVTLSKTFGNEIIKDIVISHSHSEIYVKNDDEPIYKYDFWESSRWLYVDVYINDEYNEKEIRVFFKNITVD